MTLLMCLAAVAGPMPMFGTAPTPPPATAPVAPARAVGPVGRFPVIIGSTVVVVDPEAPPPPEREEAHPALLRYVEAAPVKTRVENPGTLTPIDQLPSAFSPIPEAANHLPRVTVRPVIVIEPPSDPESASEP